jgi:hypothetical protein
VERLLRTCGIYVNSCGSGLCTPVPGLLVLVPRRLPIPFMISIGVTFIHDTSPTTRSESAPWTQSSGLIPYLVLEASGTGVSGETGSNCFNSRRPRALPFDLINLLGVRQSAGPDARQNVRRRAVAGVTGRGLNPTE